MHEAKVHADPKSYEPRNVFGVATWRGAICFAVVVLIVTAAMWAVWAHGADDRLVVLLAAPPATIVGVLALWDSHGLKAEKATPVILRERKSERVMTWAPPVVRVRREEPKVAGAERRRRRREERTWARERAGESESGGPSVSDLMGGGGR